MLRLVVLPLDRTPLRAYESGARSRSITVVTVLFATRKAAPLAPTLS